MQKRLTDFYEMWPMGWRLETVRTTAGETGDKWVKHWGDGKTVEHATLAATVLDVACVARPEWSREKLRRALGEETWKSQSLSFERYLDEKPDAARYLASRLRVRLYVVGLRKERDGFVRPILDDRHREDLLGNDARDCVILLGATGEYLGVVPYLHNLPPLACHCDLTRWQKKCKPLKEILGLVTERPEPRTVGELKEYFAAEDRKNLSCQISFLALVEGKRKAWYSERLTFGDAENCLFVEARAGADHGLVYRLISLPHKKLFNEQAPGTPPPTPRDLPSASNRASSVKVARNGLNLALDLGLLSQGEVAELAGKLGETAGALVLLYDIENCPRYLRYVDRHASFGVEIGCRPNQRKKVNGFFARVTEVAKERCSKRRDLLLPLMSRLEQLSAIKVASLYRTCLWNLQATVKKQRLLVCCPNDADLHHLKYLYGQYHYAAAPKGSKTKVHLGFTPGNDLVSVWTGNCLIFNLNTYLDVKAHPHHARLLESRPEIEHQKSISLFKGGTTPLKERCAQHCDALGAWTLDLWDTFGKNCLKDFGHDLHSTWCANLAKLCYSVVQSRLLSTCGLLDQGPEILKPFYGKLLREYSRGGFIYSCQEKISAGDEMVGSGGRFVKSILELDVNTSYGFCCSEAAIPGGFCVGFVAPDTAPQQDFLFKCDRQRWMSEEFMATYVTLLRLSRKIPNRRIRSVYSNYSRRGLFYIGKFYVDLAVVFDNGTLGLCNFDPQYTHSCDLCPPLERYMNGQSHEELRAKAVRRDNAILAWIAITGTRATYQVVSSCHDLLYSPQELKRLFREETELSHLNHLHPLQKALTPAKMLDWLLEHRNDPKLCFLAWMTGGLSPALAERYSAFVVTPSERNPGGQSILAATGETPVVLTKDHFNYLVDNFGFLPDHIKAVLFFKPDTLVNRVYREVTDLRFLSSDPLQTSFLKKVLNLSIGYFGLNENKRAPNHLLLNGVPRRFEDTIQHIAPHLEAGAGEATGSLLVYSSNKRAAGRTSSRPPNALAAYVAVVERGKLRLIELLNFFQKHLPPNSFRLAYSNTDGVHLVFSEEDYDSLVAETARPQFEQDKSLLVSEDKVPGRFKLEWHVKNDFSYVSPQIFQYAVIGRDVSLAKWSGVSRIGAPEAYAKSCELLEKGLVSVQQERRADKRSNLEVVSKTFVHKRPRVGLN